MHRRSMELELGLAPPNNYPMVKELDLNSSANNTGSAATDYHQRPMGAAGSLDDHHNINVLPQKWSTQLHSSINEDDNSGEIEGWPPIASARKELLHEEPDQYRIRSNDATATTKCMYVKVKMEGVAIGRKIDLRLYHSYPSLTTALNTMFAKYSEINADYRILYKDREGDWMLLGDVPWEMFLETVQRIEILSSFK